MTVRKIGIHNNYIETNLGVDDAVEADLRSLFAHPGWKRYSHLLTTMKAGIFEGLMGAESKDYAKRIGVAEGLSLSVNTIAHLVLKLEKKEDSLVAAESLKQSPPKG